MGSVTKSAFIWFYLGWNYTQFKKDFMEKDNGDSDKRYFLEADVQYPEKWPS